MGTSGLWSPQLSGRFGLLNFDSGNGRKLWMSQHPHNSEALLVKQCQLVKQANPHTRCFVYRQTELALGWLRSCREKMEDPAAAGMFLRFTTPALCAAAGPCPSTFNASRGGVGCCRAGRVYNEPTLGGDQFFWNFSQPETRSYFLEQVIGGPTALGSPFVDGLFADDSAGLGAEHAAAQVGWVSLLQQSLRCGRTPRRPCLQSGCRCCGGASTTGSCSRARGRTSASPTAPNLCAQCAEATTPPCRGSTYHRATPAATRASGARVARAASVAAQIAAPAAGRRLHSTCRTWRSSWLRSFLAVATTPGSGIAGLDATGLPPRRRCWTQILGNRSAVVLRCGLGCSSASTAKGLSS